MYNISVLLRVLIPKLEYLFDNMPPVLIFHRTSDGYSVNPSISHSISPHTPYNQWISISLSKPLIFDWLAFLYPTSYNQWISILSTKPLIFHSLTFLYPHPLQPVDKYFVNQTSHFWLAHLFVLIHEALSSVFGASW